MKHISAIALVLAMAAPALAQSAPQPAEKILYICWYSDAGKLTGATPAPRPMALHSPLVTGRAGDQAWAYAIRSPDGRDCPARRPTP